MKPRPGSLIQMDKIKRDDWRVLAIMDTARYDITAELLKGQTKVSLAFSPGHKTVDWLAEVVPVLNAHTQVLYISASPVVSGALVREKACFPVQHLWPTLWTYHTQYRIPQVHPEALTGAVLGLFHPGRLWGGTRLVVHYMTPHYPYIGNPPLDTTDWGKTAEKISFDLMLDKRPGPSKDVDLLRRAYTSQLRMTIDAVQHLADGLGREVVVTADHGELLGEDGATGHSRPHPLLRDVPWFTLKPRLDPDHYGSKSDLKDKLAALGYL